MHRSLLFPNSLTNSVETVAADTRHCDQVVGGAETADGQVAAVLHGLVAAGRRHVLRHSGRLEELGGALCRCCSEEVVWVRNGFAEVVLL